MPPASYWPERGHSTTIHRFPRRTEEPSRHTTGGIRQRPRTQTRTYTSRHLRRSRSRSPSSQLHDETHGYADYADYAEVIVEEETHMSEAESVDGFPVPGSAKSDYDSSFIEEKDFASTHTEPTSERQPQVNQELFNVTFAGYQREGMRSHDVLSRIELVHDPVASGVSKTDPTIFRWLHMNPTALNFETFWSVARSLPGLNETDVHNIEGLLRRIRSNKDERALRGHKGSGGRVLDPCVHFQNRTYAPFKQMDVEVIDQYFFYCLPFFELRKLSTTDLPPHSQIHPIQALLKSHRPSTSNELELQQAVCHLQDTPDNHCFHVSSLWCLGIGDKYLVTCTPGLRTGDLRGDSIGLKKSLPSDDNSDEQLNSAKIQVVFNEILYLLPAFKCTTWFMFTQYFSHLTLEFDNVYHVYCQNHHITSAHWPKLVKRLSRGGLRVYIVRRERILSAPLKEALSELSADSMGAPSEDSQSATSKRHDDTRDVNQDSLPRNVQRSHSASFKDEQSRAGEHSVSRSHLEAPMASSDDVSNVLNRKPSSSPVLVRIYLQEFHALQWMAIERATSERLSRPESSAASPKVEPTENTKRSRKSLEDDLEAYLREMHQYMLKADDFKVRRSYHRSPAKSVRDVEKAISGITKGELDDVNVLEMKTNLVRAAKSLFVIFLPLEQTSLVASKLWGAVHQIITSSVKDKGSKEIIKMEEVTASLTDFARYALPIREQLSRGKGPDPLITVLPPKFATAWYHFIASLLIWSDNSIKEVPRQVRKFESELSSAYRALFTKHDSHILENLDAPNPSALSITIMKSVLRDVTHDLPDVAGVYWEYFETVKSAVKSDPLLSAHQRTLDALSTELNVVIKNLSNQISTIWSLERGRIPDQVSSLVISFLDECSSKHNWMLELQQTVEDLSDQIREHKESNKDTQDRAIYVFTIVTIVFLPISTVSSIFGMNTKDIRDLDKSQWVFWASAIPVTLLVVIATLYIAGTNFLSPFSWTQARHHDSRISGSGRRNRSRSRRRGRSRSLSTSRSRSRSRTRSLSRRRSYRWVDLTNPPAMPPPPMTPMTPPPPPARYPTAQLYSSLPAQIPPIRRSTTMESEVRARPPPRRRTTRQDIHA